MSAVVQEARLALHAWVRTELEEGFRLREIRPVKQWARECRRVAAGGPLARGGHDIAWDAEVMPHAEEPMDAIDDPSINVIVLWWGRRMAKTEGVCINAIGRTVMDCPTNIISMWPVEDSRDRFSRDVVETTLEAMPELNARFVPIGGREQGRTIAYKRYAGGSIIINYAGSKSQTKGMAAGLVIAHEADAYPVSSQGEGDPIEKLFGRAEGFPDAIKIVESTGTLAAELKEDGSKIYHSNIEKWYDRSDQRKWFCPCRICGEGQWLKFEQIQGIVKKSGELWFYICEECGVDHDEKQWRRMVRNGAWRATAGFVNGIRGYWINGFNSLLPKGRGYTSKLHQFAAEGQRALAGTIEDRRVWVNEVKTELMPFDDDEQPAPPWKPIVDNRESYATDEKVIIPSAGLIVTSFTDVHGNRLEVDWRAFSKTEESWGLGHFVLDGDTSRPEVWEQWTAHLARKWTHESGLEMQLGIAFVDGGWRCDPAIATLRRLHHQNVPGVSGKIRISKGVGIPCAAIVHRTWATISNNAKGVHIGTWSAKELTYERLEWHGAPEDKRPTAGFLHFGKCYPEDFIRQCVNEKPVMKIINGKQVLTFKNPEGTRNEGLDMLVGCLAAFRYRRWDFEAVERQIAERKERKTDAPIEVAPAAPQMVIGRAGGWK